MKILHLIVYLFIIGLILIVTGCDKEVSHSPVAPPPSKGKVLVNSTPKGFSIYQNGRNTGRHTPDSLIFLDPGQYEITLKKLYWKDTAVVVNVSEETPGSVNINYLPNSSMYGKLVFYSDPPGANIFVNDSLTNNVTPDTLNHFLPGTYNITFKTDHHRDASFDAIVESGKIKSYSAALKDTSVWLDYRMVNSGIQSDQLSAIAIDHNGIKWIGTFDNGVIRFDDLTFTNYNTSNSPIPSNKINCVSVDAQNNVWIGTPYGIGIFNGSGWRIYDRYNSDLSTEIVNAIKFDDNNNAWIGTINNLVMFDGTNWITYNSQLGHDYITDIYIQPSGKIWLSTMTIGVLTFQNEKFFSFSKSHPDFPSLFATSVGSDKLGNIWLSFNPDSTHGSGGIVYSQGPSFTTVFSGGPDDLVNDINIDSEDNKWVCTSIGFIWYDEQNVSQVFSTFNSLISTDNTKASVRDKEGTIWIATYKGGLNKFKVNNLK